MCVCVPCVCVCPVCVCVRCVTAAGNGRQERRGGDTKGQEEHNGKTRTYSCEAERTEHLGGERPLPAHLQEIMASTDRKLSDDVGSAV